MKKMLLSIEEVAEMTGLGRSKVYDLLQSGHLRSVHVGRRRLVPAAFLDEFIEGLVSTSPARSTAPPLTRSAQ